MTVVLILRQMQSNRALLFEAAITGELLHILVKKCFPEVGVSHLENFPLSGFGEGIFGQNPYPTFPLLRFWFCCLGDVFLPPYLSKGTCM